MKRVTISVTDQLDAELAAFAKLNGYGNRSEAYRDVMRLGLEKARTKVSNDSRRCVAVLSHVFNHRMRELPARLSEAYHAHHELLVANMRVHLDEELCLDVVVLRGEVPVVREFSHKIIAERGVTHGTVSFVPSGVDDSGQAHLAIQPERGE